MENVCISVRCITMGYFLRHVCLVFKTGLIFILFWAVKYNLQLTVIVCSAV